MTKLIKLMLTDEDGVPIGQWTFHVARLAEQSIDIEDEQGPGPAVASIQHTLEVGMRDVIAPIITVVHQHRERILKAPPS